MPPKVVRGGRFVLTREMGGGAQASTWEAVDKQVGQAVVIKVFRVKGARSWKEIELAEREAKVLRSVRHELCPAYVDHFEEDGCLYLAMTRIAGTPLDEIAKADGFEPNDVFAFLRDAADILDYLHGRHPPLVHRDIKPGNVVRRPDGRYCLVDFGSVRDSLKPEGGSTVVGTFGYMAPEQFQGRGMPASDIYAVGATALFMLTGVDPDQLPHVGLKIDVPRVLAGRPMSTTLRLLERLVEPDPDRRARSLTQLLDLHRIDREGPRSTGAQPHAASRRPPFAPESPEVDSAPHAHVRLVGNAARLPLQHVIFLLLTLALTVAQLAVFLVLRRVVPLALRILSRAVHPQLRVAAGHVSQIGSQIIEELAEAKTAMSNELSTGRTEAERTEAGRTPESPPSDPSSGRRHRVDTPEPSDGDLVEPDETPEPRTRRR